CGITTLVTPLMIRFSPAVAAGCDHFLPRPLQTFAAFYGAWLERMGRGAGPFSNWSQVGRRAFWIFVDAALLAAIVIGSSVELPGLVARLERMTTMPTEMAEWVIDGVAVLLAVPFFFGIIRTAHGLGAMLAERALPHPRDSTLDLGIAPRHVLVVALQLMIVLLVGFPLVVITGPFLPPLHGFAVLAIVTAVLGLVFWRGAAGFQGHIRAGAQMIVEALATQSRAHEQPSLAGVERLFPGVGSLAPVKLAEDGSAVGATLASLNLRAVTGATVLAIFREGTGTTVPAAHETLRAGDLIALAGPEEAVAAASEILSRKAGGAEPALSLAGSRHHH
ncbi:MAG: cation:proton antiporter regulatory subunit, partial [Candidatus Binataceae bacterium]